MATPNKWLRREKALLCPIHSAIRERAAQKLSENAVFAKDEVLGELGFMAVADSIRWDYVREFIEDDQKCELIPLASAFFKKHKVADEMNNPQRYLALGYGKKTAGFGAVTQQNDHLVLCRVRQRKSMANGVGCAFVEFVNAVAERRPGLTLEKPTPAALIEAD